MYAAQLAEPPPTLLDHLFEHAGVGLCLAAADGATLRANSEWLRSTSAGAANSCRARISRVPLEDGTTLLISRCAGASDLALVFGEGAVRHLLAGATPLGEAPPGPEPAAFTHGRDDTPRSVEAQFRALTEAMPQVVCALRRDGTPAYVNARWTSFSGLDLEASARAGWPAIVHPDDLAALRACWRRARNSGAPQELELRYRSAEGAYRWFLSRIAPIRSCAGEIVRWIGVGTDIDDRKRAEAERERLLASVQDADRRKNEFLGVLSHELRNPLAPIRNSLYLLERVPASSDQAIRARAVMARQVEHLSRLVDDLLDVTRISRGKVELQRGPVELDVLVRRTVEDHWAIFAGRGVELVAPPASAPLWIHADPTRVSQVVGNLLVNAAKFTDRGGRVTVRVAQEDGYAVVAVADTGVGIAEDVLPRVFEPFVQGDGTLDRRQGGLGLGLSLVKGLVEMHGGTVEARSDGPGRGAELSIRLPLLAEPPQPERRGPRSAPRTRSRRVLVVEDNVDAAHTLRDVLQLAGHDVEVVHDGVQGVARARESRPDVVVCDIGLPGKDGYEVARELRATPDLAGVLLVAVTGYALPEDQRRAAAAGFDAHLSKPVAPDDIQRVVAAERASA
jgi:PAS domain S-box-containing protein